MRTISLVSVALIVIALSGCTESGRKTVKTAVTSSAPAPAGKSEPTASQPAADNLQITELAAGNGTAAEKGKSVTVHYRGTLADGTEFDSSRKHGKPFTFRLGAGDVIPGWDEGVQGMKIGGKRKLVVPPRMAYGSEGVPGAIPGNATLTFEVELLDVK